jgi:RNA polymerase sigma-70 factor, ECF subfamily
LLSQNETQVMALGDRFASVLAAARAGSESAWAALYHEVAPPVLAYLRSQQAADPEDLTGEIFLQVVRHLDRFSGDERGFRAWTFTIAHNRLLDERRREARRPVTLVPEEQLDRVAPGDIERDVFREFAAERVTRLMAHLSADQRTVLFLRIFGDLTVEQVADVIGKRPGAVKALQHRGLAGIRKAIEREGVPL